MPDEPSSVYWQGNEKTSCLGVSPIVNYGATLKSLEYYNHKINLGGAEEFLSPCTAFPYDLFSTNFLKYPQIVVIMK